MERETVGRMAFVARVRWELVGEVKHFFYYGTSPRQPTGQLQYERGATLALPLHGLVLLQVLKTLPGRLVSVACLLQASRGVNF